MQILFFIVGVFLQWTLEVLGAGGAIWGMSEVWHLRGGTNDDPKGSNDDLRIPANIVFVMGFIRMFFRYSQASPLKNAVVDPQVWVKNLPGRNSGMGAMMLFETLAFVYGFFLQWVLEVLGAGGACWGMSEVWNLRADNTADPWQTNHDFRWVANVVFCMGLFRMCQKYCPDHPMHTAMNAPQDWLKELIENTYADEEAGQQGGMEMTAVTTSKRAEPEPMERGASQLFSSGSS